MSAETIDLMWELHEELGSKQPINIICGFRSEETNALLKRIGRHVASQSQHVLGRAIDMQFPDVPSRSSVTVHWFAKLAVSDTIRVAVVGSSISILVVYATGPGLAKPTLESYLP